MERCRLNLRVVDEWRPGNEQRQHSKSDRRKDSIKVCIETYLHSISTNIFGKTTSLAVEGTYCITNSVKARIIEDLALEFELGELRFAGKFDGPLPIIYI